MSKTSKNSIKFILIIALVAVIAMGVVGCGKTNNDKVYFELRLSEQSTDLTFTQGEVDLSSIVVEYYEMTPNIKENTVAEKLLNTIKVTDTMVSAEDIAKLNNVGTYSIAVTYQYITTRITITIVPKIVESTYNATFNAQGGTLTSNGAETSTINATTITAIPEVTKQGYNFGGWYPNSNGSGTILVTPYKLSTDATFYAKWVNENIFTVTYVNQVTSEVILTSEVESGSTLTFPKTANLEGKTFSYWGDYLGNKITAETVTESMVLYAYYTTNQYKITISSTEWEQGLEYTVDYGQSFASQYNAISFPAKQGHTGYWVIGNSKTELDISEISSIKADLEINAYYIVNKCTVTYMIPTDHTEQIDARDFTEYATKTGNYGTVLGDTPVPIKKGYKVAIWMYLENGQYVDATEKLKGTLEEGYTVFAIYTVDVYDIVFSDGANQTKLQKAYGTYVDSFTPTNNDGSEKYNLKYKKVEWYGNSNYEESSKIAFPLLVSASKTYYIKVTDNPLQVDYTLPATVDGQDLQYATPGLIKSEYVASGSSTNNTLALELDMYDFVKWVNVNGEEVTAITDFYELSENNQLTAVLTVKEYTVVFENMTYNGAEDYVEFVEISSTANIKYDTVLQNADFPTSGTDFVCPTYHDPEDQANQDFEFDGWYTDKAFTKKVDFSNTEVAEGLNTVRSNITYYAKWVDTNRGTEGLEYTLVNDGGAEYYTISGFDPSGATSIDILYIPREHDKIAVRGIATNAFVDAMGVEIREIRLTANIEFIASNAFTGLKSLSKISFVEESISGRATSSNYLSVVDNVLMSKDETVIYLYPSAYVTTSLEYAIPATVTTINGGAFAFCQFIKVDFSSNNILVEIGDNAFFSSDIKTVESLPSSLRAIGTKAFYGCIDMDTISFADSGSGLQYVGDKALEKTAWWIAESKDSIVVFGGVLLLYGDTTATEFTIDATSGIVAIAQGAFSNDNYTLSITNITITADSGLASISANAFKGCPQLGSIYIAKGGVQLSANSFDGIQTGAKLYVESAVYAEYSANQQAIDFFGAENIISYTDEI